MKETVNANIGGEAFILDEDACRAMRDYLDDIRSRLPEEDAETRDDIERAVAEILRERVASSMRVVTLDIVRAAIARMGAPEEFGARREASPHDATPPGTTTQEPVKRRLYRSRSDRSIAGVCGGIAEFFDLDPTLVRLLTLLLILFGGLSIWVYAILWIIVPDQPARRNDIRTDTKR